MVKSRSMFEKGKSFLFSNSFKSRVFKSGIIVGAFGSAENVLRLVRNMIIVRILAPETFGVMAIIIAFNSYFEAFTEIGIKQAIIQNPDGDKKTFLNGAWWLSIGRACVLYTIAFFISPLIVDFYNTPDLTVVLIRIAFLSIIFNGLISANAYVAMKRMKFIRWGVLFNGGAIIGIIAAVILAYYLKNIWALVLGLVIEAASRSFLSYVVCPFMPGLRFNKEQFKSLVKFAKGMFGIPILFMIWLRIDVPVIGKLLGEKQLGFYAMAVVLARVPLQFISQIFNRIFLPALSEVQKDTVRVNRLILKSMTGIIFIIFPCILFVSFFGGDVLTVVWGKEYAVAAVPFIFIFSSEFLRITGIPITSSYLATGHPELHRLFNLIRAIVIVTIIYPLVYWKGLTGASLALFISMFVGLLLQLHRIKLLTKFKPSEYWLVMLKAGVTTPVIVLGWFATTFLNIHLIGNIVIGLVCVLLAIVFSYRMFPEFKKCIK